MHNKQQKRSNKIHVLYIVYQAPPASAVILRLFKEENNRTPTITQIQLKVICSLFSKMFLYLQTSNTSFLFRFYFAPVPLFAKKIFIMEKRNGDNWKFEKTSMCYI